MNKIDLKAKKPSSNWNDLDKKNIPIPRVTFLVNRLLWRNNVGPDEVLPQATI